MKSHVRVLAFDDGPFKFTDRHAPLAGVLVRLPNYVEAVLIGTVQVDGEDAGETIGKMVRASPYRDQPKAMMLDGAAMGGFNVIDIDVLSQETEIAVITLTRDKPDMKAVKGALKINFDDWDRRYGILSRRKLRKLDTGHSPVYYDCAGMEFREAEEIIRKSIVQGAIPEPLRLAHLVATAAAKGESRGRA
ncbi:MAG: DUF99 family protein [Methanobacteriota archaeon]